MAAERDFTSVWMTATLELGEEKQTLHPQHQTTFKS